MACRLKCRFGEQKVVARPPACLFSHICPCPSNILGPPLMLTKVDNILIHLVALKQLQWLVQVCLTLSDHRGASPFCLSCYTSSGGHALLKHLLRLDGLFVGTSLERYVRGIVMFGSSLFHKQCCVSAGNYPASVMSAVIPVQLKQQQTRRLCMKDNRCHVLLCETSLDKLIIKTQTCLSINGKGAFAKSNKGLICFLFLLCWKKKGFFVSFTQEYHNEYKPHFFKH